MFANVCAWTASATFRSTVKMAVTRRIASVAPRASGSADRPGGRRAFVAMRAFPSISVIVLAKSGGQPTSCRRTTPGGMDRSMLGDKRDMDGFLAWRTE